MTWARTRAFPTSTRLRILRRDPTCMACGQRPSTKADHVIPAAEGGSDDESNGQGLCAECHEAKTKAERERGMKRYAERRPRQKRRSEAHPGLK